MPQPCGVCESNDRAIDSYITLKHMFIFQAMVAKSIMGSLPFLRQANLHCCPPDRCPHGYPKSKTIHWSSSKMKFKAVERVRLPPHRGK